MAEFEYQPASPFRSYMGIYNAEQIRAQQTFLELIEEETLEVLNALRDDVFPKVPKDILTDAENHFVLTVTGSEWIVEAALQQKRENGELSAIPSIVRQDELRDALVEWADRFNMNHLPPDMVSPLGRAHQGKPPAFAESTFWYFQVACDTLSEWIKEKPQQLKWAFRAIQPAPLLGDIAQPFVFTHPMPLPRSNGSEFLEMLKEDVIEHFDRGFKSYLEHLEALNKAPTTYGEIQVRYAHEVDELSTPNPTISYIDYHLKQKVCIAEIRVANMIRQYLFPVPEPATDTPLPMAPVYLDPFVFRHQGIKLDTQANMTPKVEDLVKGFDLALNERLGCYHSKMNHGFNSLAHVGNREPLIITLDGWNPLEDQDRTTARKRLLKESQRQIDAYLERQEEQPDVTKKKSTKAPDTGYFRLIEHVIKGTPLTDIAEDLDLEPDSILRSIRPLAHTLGISLRDSVAIKDISLLSKALENKTATLIIKHHKEVISLTWATRGDLTFLQKNGYAASRISRLLRAIEECYYQGHQLPDTLWRKTYSLSRDRWRDLCKRIEKEGGFFLPLGPREEQGPPLRGVLCVARFLNGEHLEEILASLWIDQDLWKWYWHGFLRTKLTQNVEGFPAELVSGWTRLWDGLNISSEKIDELTNLVGSKLAPSTKTTPTLSQDQSTIFYPLVDMVDSVDRITAIPFNLAESLNQRIRGVIASVRKNKLRIRLSELYFLLAFSPNDDHIIEPSFSDVLIK